MTERGLMSSVMSGKKRLFTAEAPYKLLAYAKRKETEMKEEIHGLELSLPELELQLGGERPIVQMYEGKEGIRAFMEEVRKVKPKTIIEVADADAVLKAMSSEELAPFRKEVSRHQPRIKGIYTGTIHVPTIVERIERILLPANSPRFSANITVFGDRVGLVSLEGKPYSIIIENKSIAQTLELMFDLAYVEAKRRGKVV
jgi:hypothetical protein